MSRRMRRRQWRGGASTQALNAMAAWLDAPLRGLQRHHKTQAQVRQSLLRFLLTQGLISDQQLVQARQESAASGEDLFAIFVRHRWLEFDSFDSLRPEAAPEAGRKQRGRHLRLGEILIATGRITPTQLEHCLSAQKASGKRIGEALIEAGYVKAHQIVEALLLQCLIITSNLVAVLMTTLVIGALVGAREALAGEARATSLLTVSATVLKHASVRVLSMPAQLTLTQADVARGYVDVPQPAQVEVKTNNPAGFVFAFDSDSELVRQVDVSGIGDTASFSGTHGAVISRNVARVSVLNLNIRFQLAPGAQPGVYAWPLNVSVTPL